MEEEIWKTIEGYPKYEISSFGRVKSYWKYPEGRILKPVKNRDGYIRANLCKDKKHIAKNIHRLVSEAFIPNKGNKPQVNHIDGNKNNNKVSNLEWCTHSENMSHSYATGLKGKGKDYKGNFVKTPEHKIKEVSELIINYDLSHREISRRTNVCTVVVARIAKGINRC